VAAEAGWNYIVQGSKGAVELWSTVRLPFERSRLEWVEEMRTSLRDSLSSLSAEQGWLSAVFAGPDALRGAAFDIENVLFYNVGTKHFRQSSKRGLRFERASVAPDPPAALSGSVAHYARYEAAKPLVGEFSHWKIGALAASFEAALPALSSSSRASTVWLALKRGDVQVSRDIGRDPFALRLTLTGPSVSLADVLKPVLDGVIAAFHSHDGSDEAAIIERLAAQTGAEESELRGHLEPVAIAPLDQRSLLYLRGDGVHWNPADDLCVACEIRAEVGAEWSIAGELASITRS